jgi:amidase
VPSGTPWLPLSVKGPIARSVEDIGFFLTGMAGFDARDQLSYDVDVAAFGGDLSSEPKGLRVAFCPDLGGLPLDPDLRAVLNSTRSVFEAMGCQVDDVAPDLTDADRIFKDLRAFSLTTSADLLQNHRDLLKPEAIWNIEAGLKLSAHDVASAMTSQAALFQRMNAFMARYDAIICAVNQVPPFPIDVAWPREIDGVQMETYIDWMKSAYFITVTRQPAISVPAGFTPDGLPVGVQIVGRYKRDLDLLKFAHAFEQASGVGKKRPPIAE